MATDCREEVDMNFGGAITLLNLGRRVSRRGWNGPGRELALEVPNAESKMTIPYMYIKTVQGDFVP